MIELGWLDYGMAGLCCASTSLKWIVEALEPNDKTGWQRFGNFVAAGGVALAAFRMFAGAYAVSGL